VVSTSHASLSARDVAVRKFERAARQPAARREPDVACHDLRGMLHRAETSDRFRHTRDMFDGSAQALDVHLYRASSAPPEKEMRRILQSPSGKYRSTLGARCRPPDMKDMPPEIHLFIPVLRDAGLLPT